jgi:hypothetical protein
MTLHEQIKGEMKEAMKAKNQPRLMAIRGLLSAFMNEAVTKRYKPDQILTNEEALVVIKRAVNQRKDAINQFKTGGREDLAANEQGELVYLEKYLPQMMSCEEIKKIAGATASTLGVDGKANAGKLMSVLMKELKGRADGADVKAVVDELLG